jgi:Cdc6-like AAA superfamily ATPase
VIEQYVWVEKYRPKKLDDVVLPESIKEKLQRFVEKGNLPNLLFSGPPGCGKTTVAKAMLEELGCDYIVINGSLEGNIDTLRVKIKQYASSVSMKGTRKYVILDEADELNRNSTQPALRNFMEEYSKNLKEKNFTEIRKWVTHNNDISPDILFANLYAMSVSQLEPNSVAQLVLILADYQYKQAFVSNTEINITACLVEIMAGCAFK